MISIEGNVGVGKSTVLKELKGTVREERVESWTLLPAFYRESEKYAFAFQLQVMSSYADAEVDYLERSPKSAFYIFSKILHADGFLNDADLEILRVVYERLPKPNKHVYLRLPAAKCLERIKKRAREGEQSISLEYLEKIEAEHDKTFALVIDLDGTESPQQIASMIAKVL